MIPRYLKKTFKLHVRLLSQKNIHKIKVEHILNSKCLHQFQNQDHDPISNDVKDDKLPLINSSKTTNIDNPHYLSCIHKPLTINLQKTDSVNGNRRYLAKYPSVTTVLSNTKPSSEFFGLMQWRKTNIEKLGKEKFGVMQRVTTTKGTNFHQEMKTYFSNLDNLSPKGNTIENSGFFQSVINVLPNTTNPLAIESSVVHSQLGYAGTVDLVAEYLGKLSIIDWKTSQKKRTKLKDLHSYPVQLAAYAGAINYDNDYPFQISHGVLVVAYENGDPADVHVLDEQVLEEFWDKWLQRLNEYKAKCKDGTDWDIKGSDSTAPTDISTNGPLVDTLGQGTNLDGSSETNENGTKEGFYGTSQGPIPAVSPVPNVRWTKRHELYSGSGWNSVAFISSVQRSGKKLNQLGRTVKDEDIISSWRSLSGSMESIFGKVFVSKGLLFSHYFRTVFMEMFKTIFTFGNQTKKKL